MQTVDAQRVVQEYIGAIGARDLTRCIDAYAEDADLDAGPASCRGREALEEWHKERFAADLQVVRIKNVTADGDTVTVDGAITSRRIKAWRIGSLSGRATFHIRDGKIAKVHFGLGKIPVLGFHRQH